MPTNNSPLFIDSYGALVGDLFLDSIQHCSAPIINLTPHIQTPTGTFYTDTLLWVPISGTFIASGNEKYLVLGNFRSNANTNTAVANPSTFPGMSNDLFIDDVTLVEISNDHFAGPDIAIKPGDSTFIGSPPEFLLNDDCVWYSLPAMNPLDTALGIWVKPAITSSYVVRWEVCGTYKWDTVVVSPNLTSLKEEHFNSDVNVFPVPANCLLEVQGISVLLKENSDVRIYNTMGYNTIDATYSIINEKLMVNTADLPNGAYFIVFGNKVGRIIRKRFLVMH